MTTEERLGRLEGAYEQVDKRLGDLALAVNSLRQEMADGQAALRQEMADGQAALRQDMTGQLGNLRSEMNGRFNTLLVIGAGAWVTTVGLIIGLYLQS
ncbi:MAG: hypothetical protein F4052_06780 [Dehalococcoidia bacterium]|nr:hypothetical protein [Chloroflexota bacterium]MYK26636.1 hypothetical protein [Dehalococcoidia bacterium]